MAELTCSIIGADTGHPLDAKVHVLSLQSMHSYPPDAILKVGPDQPFLYAHRQFAVELPMGEADVVVERSTE